MKRPFWLTIALSLILTTTCLSQANEDHYTTLINDFAQAIKNKDEASIASTWHRLNADTQAQSYMNDYYPVVASDFRLTGTALQATRTLQQFKKAYPQTIEFPQRPERPTFFREWTNQNTVSLYPNNEQPTIQEMHSRRMNAPLPDNRSQAMSMPNQQQRSNQDYIKARVDRMSPTAP